MANHTSDTKTTQANAESRQQRRKEQRQAKKDRARRQKVNERIEIILKKQTAAIMNSGLPSAIIPMLLQHLNDTIEKQEASGMFCDIIGLSQSELEAITGYKTSPEGLHNVFGIDTDYIKTPNILPGFISMETIIVEGVRVYAGKIIHRRPRCPVCKGKMWKDGSRQVLLHHLPEGDYLTFVTFLKNRYRCCNPNCDHTEMEEVPFQADDHNITKPLENHICVLLEHQHTNREAARMTGVNDHLVKAIDKKRLENKYTEVVNGQRVLKKPDKQARILMVDEFKLHNGNEMATIIINGDTGEALWMQATKSKQVIYDFMNHVGDEWMQGVEAVACDMNADFQEAFREWYPSIRVVYDHFHIVKNFNEKVISMIRSDEERRLVAEGRPKEAARLKRSKFILTASRKTLRKMDKEAEEGKTTRKASPLFKRPESKRRGGKEAKYDALITENKLLFTCDLIKELLERAYSYQGQTVSDRLQMGRCISRIIRLCEATNNKHFKWFAKLLEKHRYGIVSYATYPISSGKMEGINQKIKTVRRIAYGLPDDDYFFLKVMDFTHESGKQKEEVKQKSITPKVRSASHGMLMKLTSIKIDTEIEEEESAS